MPPKTETTTTTPTHPTNIPFVNIDVDYLDRIMTKLEITPAARDNFYRILPHEKVLDALNTLNTSMNLLTEKTSVKNYFNDTASLLVQKLIIDTKFYNEEIVGKHLTRFCNFFKKSMDNVIKDYETFYHVSNYKELFQMLVKGRIGIQLKLFTNSLLKTLKEDGNNQDLCTKLEQEVDFINSNHFSLESFADRVKFLQDYIFQINGLWNSPIADEKSFIEPASTDVDTDGHTVLASSHDPLNTAPLTLLAEVKDLQDDHI